MMQSLCPDCRHNVLDVLDPMFENGIAKNMKLRCARIELGGNGDV